MNDRTSVSPRSRARPNSLLKFEGSARKSRANNAHTYAHTDMTTDRLSATDPGFDTSIEQLIAEVEDDPKLLTAVEAALKQLSAPERWLLANAMTAGDAYTMPSNLVDDRAHMRISSSHYARGYSIRVMRKALIDVTLRDGRTVVTLTDMGRRVASWLV